MGFINTNISTLCITRYSIPRSWSVVISVPVTRQRRHLKRIQCVLTRLPEVFFNANISQECIAKNTSGKRPQVWCGYVGRHNSISGLLRGTGKGSVDEEGIERCGRITSKTGHGCPLTTSWTQLRTTTNWRRVVIVTHFKTCHCSDQYAKSSCSSILLNTPGMHLSLLYIIYIK